MFYSNYLYNDYDFTTDKRIYLCTLIIQNVHVDEDRPKFHELCFKSLALL